MKWKKPAIIGAALMAVLGFIPLHVLQIDVPGEGRTVLARAVRPGDDFSVGYVHSVELSPVRDYFRVDESYRIILYDTTFRSLNTGLPSTLTGNERLVREGGHFRVSGLNRVLPFLDLQVHESTDHELKIDDNEPVKLHRLAGNTLLRIRIHETSIWRYLYLRMKTS